MAKFEKIYQNFHKKTVQKNFPLTTYIYTTLGINITIILALILLKSRLPPLIPLYYGLAEGRGQLATRFQIIYPSALSLIYLGINLAIAYFLENDFLKKVLILTPLVATFFSAITTIKIILLVGNI